MKAKILIVGGGVMGTSIAIEAARRSDPLRDPVVLVERHDVGAGSSGRSGAILRQQYGNRETAVMARDSLRHFAGFEGRTGRSIGFHRTGVMTLVGPDQPEWAERIRRNVAMMRELGIRTEILEARRIRELVPGISVRRGSIAAWEPDAGFVDPLRTVRAFAALARSYGAVTRRGVAVREIQVEGGRVCGVTTDEGEISAEKVVVVAGPWSGRLLASVGVGIPLRVVCPENLFFPLTAAAAAAEDAEMGTPEGEARDTNLGFDIEDDPGEVMEEVNLSMLGVHPTVIDLENALYCRCHPQERRLRVGRVRYEGDRVLDDPDRIAQEPSDEVRAWARETLPRRLPEYAERQDVDGVVGWYTLTPDSEAVVGPVPSVEGLYVATGFSGHGFKLGPSIGEGVAQMLFGEPVTAFEPEFFSPGRFTGDEGWSGCFGL